MVKIVTSNNYNKKMLTGSKGGAFPEKESVDISWT